MSFPCGNDGCDGYPNCGCAQIIAEGWTPPTAIEKCNHNWRREWAGGEDYLYACSICFATIVNAEPDSNQGAIQLERQKTPAIIITGGE